MVSQIKGIQLTLVKHRLRFTYLIVMFYVIHKIFDLHDKPFSFDNHLVGLIGFCVLLFGLLLRSWAAGIIIKNKKLTTSGPYAIWRHPLYLGSLFIAIGFCVIMNDWFLWVIILVLSIMIYLPKIKQEERKLNRLYPEEWKDYQDKTGMILTAKLSFNNVLDKWSFKLWLRNREYNPWIAVIIVLAVIEYWHTF